MAVGVTLVDSTYRWIVVGLMTAILISVLLPSGYRKGFPRRAPFEQIVGSFILVCSGLVLSWVFDESMLDAVLLRAKFGFTVPDTGIHGYGWAFVFGYAILFANLIVLVAGGVAVRLGLLPPWIKDKDDAKGS